MIQIKQLKKQYKNHIVTYDALLIEKKHTIIKGENGTGKTTLLKAIASLISYDGSIKCDESVIYIPDQLDVPYDIPLIDWLRAVFSDTNGLNEWLELFSLIPHIQKQCHALSNGMKQKCKLLFAILLPHQVVLFDEPFVGLDHDAICVLLKWIKHTDKQIVIATHQQQLLSTLDAEVLSL